MVQGTTIRAEVEGPSVVEIPSSGTTVDLEIRIGLVNEGAQTFVAHARCEGDTFSAHVFDEHLQEVSIAVGANRSDSAVQVVDGLHSYRTATVSSGLGVSGDRTVQLRRARLKSGATYTLRCEVYGHAVETQFVCVPAKPAPPKKEPAKKAGAKKRPAKKRPAKKRPAKKRTAKKAGARKAKKAPTRKRGAS